MTGSTCHHQLLCTIIAVISPVLCVHLKKTNLFNSGGAQYDDFTRLPATFTIPLYDCSNSYRPQPGIPNAYEVYHNYQWHVHFCQEGLLWNETLCRCHPPYGQMSSIQCNDFRAASTEPSGKYKQLVNDQWIVRHCSHAALGLVWDQEVCQCVWRTTSNNVITDHDRGSCDVMLNMTFEDGIIDYGKNSFVEMRKRDQIKTPTLSKEESSDGSKAAYFNDTTLKIWYFAGNEMGTSLRVDFRFKLAPVPAHDNKYQMFISNGCRGSTVGFTTPSLAIGYRAADQTYVLAFETPSARKAVVCSSKWDPYTWNVVSLVYNDGTLILSVNNRLCIVSREFSGPIQRTHCPLTIGADPLLEGSMVKGYLDNLLVARHCKLYEEGHAYPVVNGNSVIPETFSALHGNLLKQQKANTVDEGAFLDQTRGVQESQIPSTKYMSQVTNRMNTQPTSIKHLDGTRSLDFAKLNSYTASNRISATKRNSLNKLVASSNFKDYMTKVRPHGKEFKTYEKGTRYPVEKVNKDSDSSKTLTVTSRKEYSDKIIRKLNTLNNLINSGMIGHELYNSKINNEHTVDYVKPKRNINDNSDNYENRSDSSIVWSNIRDSTQIEDEDAHNKKNQIKEIHNMDKKKVNDDNDIISKEPRAHDTHLEAIKKENHNLNSIHDSDKQSYSNTYNEMEKTKTRNNDLQTNPKARNNKYTYFTRVSKEVKNSKNTDISAESTDGDASERFVLADTDKDKDIITGSKGRKSYSASEYNDKRNENSVIKDESTNRRTQHNEHGIERKVNNSRGNDFAPETESHSYTRNKIIAGNRPNLFADSTHDSATGKGNFARMDKHSRHWGLGVQLNDTLHNTGGQESTDQSDNRESYDNYHHNLISNENKGHALENEYTTYVVRPDWGHDDEPQEDSDKYVTRHTTHDRHRGHRYEDVNILTGLKNAPSVGETNVGETFLNNAEYGNKMTDIQFRDNEENSDFEHKSSSVTSVHAPITGKKHETERDNDALQSKYNKPNMRDHERVSPRWYDVGASPHRVRPPHLIGVDLSHGSRFIIDRRYRKNQKPLELKQNFIKGRRRSGSKKNTWYDKANTSKEQKLSL